MRAALFGLLVYCLALPLQAADPWPEALTRFEPLATQPVFRGAGEGAWDARIRERGAILQDGDGWKLWYTGYDGTRPGLKMLGYATSPDGLTWTRSPQNPLYREHWVEDVSVIKHAGTYYMAAEGFLDRAQLLTSPDGLNWTRQGLLDVRMKDGRPLSSGPYGTSTLWVEAGVWSLFYERRDAGVWLARSTDLKVWTNVQDEPVMTPGPEEHDCDLIALNQVIRHQGKWYGFYHGCADSGPKARLWNCGVAVSDDLRRWMKYEKNPILPVEANVSSGIVVHDGDGFRFYTMHPEIRLHRSRKAD